MAGPPDVIIYLTGPLALALILERIAGYPSFVFRSLGHPVTWMGRLIGWLETHLNQADRSDTFRRRAGIVCILILLGITLLASLGVIFLALLLPFGIIILVVAASALLAARSLDEHVLAVAKALDGQGLEAGRVAVAQIVGRNPAALDEHGVARAAIESLAENFSDGIVAPALWMGVLGLPGAALYKAINTADSMIGHRTSRYEAFGWAAAKLDDWVNWPASRVSALLLIFAAWIHPDTNALSAWRAVRRDARRHCSPNAGWPEAAMAGALDLKLAGPRVYGQARIEDAFMGDGRTAATPADIRRALRLMRTAWGLQLALILSISALLLTGQL